MKFAELNEEQRAAVTFPHNLLLTACPGSGKTRVVAHKVAWEIENAASPRKKVVALTYTIRAAEEIENRLEHANVDPTRFWAGNIHSFCLTWILRPYASFYDKTKTGFAVIDDVRSKEILTQIIEELGLSTKVSIWDMNTKINPNGIWASTAPDMVRILNVYDKYLAAHRLVDFDRILFYAFDLLRLFPKICQTLSSVFSVILVDEYQDTQELQYQILFQLYRNGEGKLRVCFLGDPDQAIYGSMGGVAKSKSQIEEGLGHEIHQLTLPGNYRSTQRIVDFYRSFQAQELAIEARGIHAKTDGCITFNETIHRDNVVDRLVGLIQIYLDQGISVNEICVLVPQWHLIMSVAGRLRKALPDVSIDATGLSPASGSRDNFFYKLTRILLTEPAPKVYSRRVKWAKELIEELVHYYSDQAIAEAITPKTFLRVCNRVQSMETDVVAYLTDCFEQIFNQLKLPQNAALISCQDSYIKGTSTKIKDDRYVLPNDINTFRNFFKESNGIVVSSCHGVKGEEFEVVIAFGILSELIPHWKAIKDRDVDHIAASNKLLYVICSRAKRFLHLIAERGRTMGTGRWRRELNTTAQLSELEYDYDDLLEF